MNEIVRWTTPTITIRFPSLDPEDITSAYLTIKQGGGEILRKGIEDAVIIPRDTEDGSISWTLSQTECGKLNVNTEVRVYCDWVLNDGTRGRSRMAIYKVVEAGVNEVI